MNNNYNKIFEETVSNLTNNHFEVTIYYYNPNIELLEEHEKRKQKHKIFTIRIQKIRRLQEKYIFIRTIFFI